MIEIIVALVVIGLAIAYISYVTGFFAFFPPTILIFLTLLIALNVVLFIIHRK